MRAYFYPNKATPLCRLVRIKQFGRSNLQRFQTIKMNPNRDNNHAFIIRFWLEQRELDDARPIWRGVVEHVASGEKLYLKNIEDVKQFIVSYLPGAIVFQE